MEASLHIAVLGVLGAAGSRIDGDAAFWYGVAPLAFAAAGAWLLLPTYDPDV